MALVERIMHDPSEPPEQWIPVHSFFAACHEIIGGFRTSAQIQSYFAMTAEDLVDWNAVVATMPPQNQTANRALWVNGIHSCFILAEDRAPFYSTPDEVRTRLGI